MDDHRTQVTGGLADNTATDAAALKRSQVRTERLVSGLPATPLLQTLAVGLACRCLARPLCSAERLDVVKFVRAAGPSAKALSSKTGSPDTRPATTVTSPRRTRDR